MSSVENVNDKELYQRALENPMAVDSDTLSALIDRFPYAQALRVAQARKNYHDNGAINTENVLLVTGLPHWLYGHVIAEAPSADAAPQAERADAPIHIETVIPDIDDSGLIEHAIGLDYFTYEEKTADETETAPVDLSQEVVH